ncbi:uncharacterized protein LOC119078830 [Bradysia coprophila]|uniref:uncharacterized protein LOC119078830 n=1 Tax=Bradysia coprophila TaxID=38358 RepID=UPI00187D8DF2|nr:uncharacterized protein LOC119078830 [Bradysia coprophila]
MLRILLVLLTIYNVNGQIRCLLSTYVNNVGLTKELSGTYYVIYTSATVLDCEQNTWTIGIDNTLSVDIQSTGCCMQIQNFDSSNKTQFSYTIVSPTASGCALSSTEKTTMKIIKQINFGGDTCLIIYICRPSRQGLLVLCRNRNQPNTLLGFINALLTTLLGLLFVPELRKVNQIGCLGSSTCIL